MLPIEFDEINHIYRIEGIIIPSVTQIINGIGLIKFYGISPEILERKAEIGRYVHTACEFYDQDNLNMDTLHTELKGYLDGWIKFKTDFKFEPIEIELMLFHPTYRFAGRIDRIGLIGKDKVLIDIKSGVPQKSDCIQTAGYQILHEEGKGTKDKIKKRMSVYLNKGGDYSVIEHKEMTDKNIFLSALSIYNFKRRK